MSDEALRRALHEAEAAADPARWVAAARLARRSADDPLVGLERAASALDRAFGLAPELTEVRDLRREVLDALEVREHDLVFRYVPAGVFRMGSEDGEPDERPVHEVELDAFWITDVPLSWPRFLNLMGWSTAQEGGYPEEVGGSFPDSHQVAPGVTLRASGFSIGNDNKIRWRYCQDANRLDDEPDEGDPHAWDHRPMVAVPWEWPRALGMRLSARTPGVFYRLPTEAEWEKAARGGLVGARFAWGDEPPAGRCDFDGFQGFGIAPSTRFPGNGYALFAMCGGVWEWTEDWYDAQAYASAPHRDPRGPVSGRERVIRGGSWADCADAVTVTFRASRQMDEGGFGSPNIGFRLVRSRRAP